MMCRELFFSVSSIFLNGGEAGYVRFNSTFVNAINMWRCKMFSIAKGNEIPKPATDAKEGGEVTVLFYGVLAKTELQVAAFVVS